VTLHISSGIWHSAAPPPKDANQECQPAPLGLAFLGKCARFHSNYRKNPSKTSQKAEKAAKKATGRMVEGDSADLFASCLASGIWNLVRRTADCGRRPHRAFPLPSRPTSPPRARQEVVEMGGQEAETSPLVFSRPRCSRAGTRSSMLCVVLCLDAGASGIPSPRRSTGTRTRSPISSRSSRFVPRTEDALLGPGRARGEPVEGRRTVPCHAAQSRFGVPP
jgi:hypothetical protein